MEKERLIDQMLDEEEYDAYLIRDDSSNADLYYLTGFEASDPFIYLRKGDESIMVVSKMEYSRARNEADVDRVVETSEILDSDEEREPELLIEQLTQYFGIDSVAVPGDFPLALAEELSQEREVSAVKVSGARKTKTPEEIRKLEEAQRVTGNAMKKAEKILKQADVKSGNLFLDGESLTSEKLREEINVFLLRQGCRITEDFIVSSGPESAKPHADGSGPISAREPVVVDIFPRHNMYFGDMTRTFVKGKPQPELRKMYDAVREAKKAALSELEAGIEAGKIHNRVCDVLEEKGFDTMREDSNEGFIHSTGHSVGLELHEKPGLSDNGTELEAGNVVTVEPGLYYNDVGGIRLEDMVVVEEDGFRNFNSMKEELRV